MALNGSGIRDTGRVLKISPTTVINELKKRESSLESVNRALLESLDPSKVIVKMQRVDEAELDEMWSYVGSKDDPRWLWHAAWFMPAGAARLHSGTCQKVICFLISMS